MKVVITGGGGFLGQLLARALLERGRLTGPDGNPAEIDDVVLFDHAATPPLDAAGPVRSAEGDIGDRETVTRLIDRDDIAVFHLASVVSGILRIGACHDRHAAPNNNYQARRDNVRRTSAPRVLGPICGHHSIHHQEL